MRCMHINIRKATFILLTVLINRIQMDQTHSSTGENETHRKSEATNVPYEKSNDVILNCPTNLKCQDLPGSCIKCNLTEKCIYGETLNTTCEPEQGVTCSGSRSFPRKYICRYCYQTNHWEHDCELSANCNSVTSPLSYYITNCTVKHDIVCLGLRTFKKKLVCNWTGGYRWSTTLLLSITLGGFGADRFYLGHWQEGIGKLFSFGGLGVWTIIDVILISLHYLGPADGSLYI